MEDDTYLEWVRVAAYFIYLKRLDTALAKIANGTVQDWYDAEYEINVMLDNDAGSLQPSLR